MLDTRFFCVGFWEKLNNILIKKGNPFTIEVINDRGRINATEKYKELNGYSIALYPRMAEARIEKGYMKAMASFSLIVSADEYDDVCNKIIDRLISYVEPTEKQVVERTANLKKGEEVFSLGHIWSGRNYTDLVNQIFHTTHKLYQRATVDLRKYRAKNAVGWIVFINGEPHGFNGDLWVNEFLGGGDIIKETYVGYNRYKIEQDFITQRWLTFCDRLVFQKDPNGIGEEYKAKCCGFYALKSYDIANLVRVWERKKDALVLKF